MSRRAAQDQAKIIRGVIERFPVDAPGAPATRTAAVRDALLEVADRIEGNRGGGGDADRREPADKLIARRLEISEQTVKAHATSAFRRIGVDDRTQAALWARRNGLVDG